MTHIADRFRHLSAYVVPAAAAACFSSASLLPRFVPEGLRLTTLVAACVVMTAAVAAAAALSALSVVPSSYAPHFALTPTLLAASGYAAFLVAERDITRIAVATVTVGLLAAFFAYVAGMKGSAARYDSRNLGHLAAAMHLVAAFFALGFAFALPSYSSVPPVAVALAVAAMTGLVSWETLWHEGFARATFVPVSVAFAALGGEFYAALSLLPLSPLIDAAVGSILLVTGLSTASLSLKGAAAPQRQYVLAAFLLLLVLSTARWT